MTFCNDQAIWLEDILPALPQSMEGARSLLYTLLSFSASHMAFLTQMPSYSRAAIVYRGYALQLLQGDLHGDFDTAAPTFGQVSQADAAIGAAILLADQAALEGDWQANTLHLRGVQNLCTHAVRVRRASGVETAESNAVSKFASSRASLLLDPGALMSEGVNVSALQNTADGRACLQYLLAMRSHFWQESGRLYPSSQQQPFAGSSLQPDSTETQQLSFSPGGVGHLLALACQVYELKEMIATLADGSNTDSHLPAALQKTLHGLLLFSQHWIVSVPKAVMTAAFEEDLPCTILFAYKFGLDLLLHRAVLLLDKHLPVSREDITPSPNVVQANAFVANLLQQQQVNLGGVQSAQRVWLNWPAWTHTWSRAYTDPTSLMMSEERRRSSATHSFASSLDSGASSSSFMGRTLSLTGALYTHRQEGAGSLTPPSVSTTPITSTFAASAMLQQVPLTHNLLPTQQRLPSSLAEIEEGVAFSDHAFFAPEEMVRYPGL